MPRQPRKPSPQERQERIRKILATGPKTPEQLRTITGTSHDMLTDDMAALAGAGYVQTDRLGMHEWLYTARDPVPELAHIYSPPVTEPITGTRLCQPSGVLASDRGVRKDQPRMYSSAWQTMID